VLSLSDENFGKMVSGKTKAQNLFMSGKLKIKGNVMKGKSVLDMCCVKWEKWNKLIEVAYSDEDGTDIGKGSTKGEAIDSTNTFSKQR
jgi:hypothetical protein